MSVKAPVFIPDISVNIGAEEKDIDFEVKSADNTTKGFVGLTRVSITKKNSHGSIDLSEDNKRID